MPVSAEEAKVYLVKSESELLRELGERSYVATDGRLLIKKSAGGDPGDDERNGKRVFEFLEPRLREAICVQWEACKKIKANDDVTTFFSAVSDAVLASAVAAPLPAATLTALLLKIGIKKFCRCE